MPSRKFVVLAVGALAVSTVLGVTLNGYVKPPPHRDANPIGRPAASKLGYLAASDLPDTAALLPPPPQSGSEAMQSDDRARAAALPLRGTPRYALAAADAVRSQRSTVTAFECAFGLEISMARTPVLYTLLSRVHLDVRAASYPAKRRFHRPRPFVVHDVRSCYSDDEEMVHDDGSYPSARAATGWAFASVLAQLRPERSAVIQGRAREFGQSRVVCDQEWASDVQAGYTVAMAMGARLRANPAFNADMAAARREVEAELAEGAPRSPECKSEGTNLASR